LEDTKINRMLKVIYLLLLNGNMSGDQLSKQLNVSLRSVQRYIKQLNRIGFSITSRSGGYRGGYKLNLSPEMKKNLLELIYFSSNK